jgi:hypothetical protein
LRREDGKNMYMVIDRSQEFLRIERRWEKMLGSRFCPNIKDIVQIEAVGIGLLNWHSAGTYKNCQNPRSAMLSISWVIVMLELYEMKYIGHYLY